MSRSVITYAHRLGGTPELALKPGEPIPPPEDKYKDRLLKYIPGEVITLYLTLTAIQATATGLPWWIGWAIFIVGAAATWCYLRASLGVTDPTQLIISTLSFCVWAFALGGPFKDLSWYQPVYGGLLLPIFTFGAAMFKTAPQKQS